MKAIELLSILEKKLEDEYNKGAATTALDQANIEYLEKAIIVIKVELDLL